MYVLKLYDVKLTHLERFTDIVSAFNFALESFGKWELFYKVDQKPAKLLAYKEF